MSFQRKLFWLENWHQSSSVQLWQTLVCKHSLKLFSSLLQSHMDIRKQTEKLLILTIRTSQDLSLKSKPTWTLDTVTVLPLYVSYRVNLNVAWVSTCLVLVKGAKLSNVTQFMAESRENVTNAVAGDIIGVYDTGTYQVGDTLTVGKTNLNLNHCQPSLLKFLWKFLLRMSWSRNPSTRGLSNWCKKVLFSFIRITKQANTCWELLVNSSLKSLNTAWKASTMRK